MDSESKLCVGECGTINCGDDCSNTAQLITVITNVSYCHGVVALARSLILVGTLTPLTCITTSDDVAANLRLYCFPYLLPNLRIVVDSSLMDSAGARDSNVVKTHGAKGALLSVDAPRRGLWLRKRPFIFLDADTIAVGDMSPLLKLANGVDRVSSGVDITTASAQPDMMSSSIALYAVGNFRLKKNKFNGAMDNFNAGLMVVPNPSEKEFKAIVNAITDACVDDTEEIILNKVFRGRWAPLSPHYNLQKRCFKYSPKLWNELVPNARLIHFVGNKPWFDHSDTAPQSDWESIDDYVPLHSLWHKLFRGDITCDDVRVNSLNQILPRALEITK